MKTTTLLGVISMALLNPTTHAQTTHAILPDLAGAKPQIGFPSSKNEECINDRDACFEDDDWHDNYAWCQDDDDWFDDGWYDDGWYDDDDDYDDDDEDDAEPDIAVEQPAGTNLVDNVASIAFGSSPVGAAVVTKTFVIRNTGDDVLTGLAISKSGSHAGDFVVGSLSSTSIEPDDSLTFTVAFKPKAIGTRSAILRIASSDPDENPFDIKLSGKAVKPAPEIAVEQPKGSNQTDGKAKRSFGTVKRGRTATAKTFTIKNVGSANLTNLAVSIAGKHPKDYVITQPRVKSLKPGASTTFKVSFKPTTTGTRSALLKIRSNDKDENPFDINLTGLGAK